MELSPGRILIVKPSAIGDVVHALPVLARVRRKWPQAHISWLIVPACAGLVQRHPMIDEVIVFDRARYRSVFYNPAAAWDFLGFLKSLRSRKFELVIDLQGLFRSALSAHASGAPNIIGFSNAREGAPFFYTQLVDCSWERDHAVERYLKIADALGCPAGPVEFPFAVDDADRQYIRTLIPDGVRYAVLMPATNWETKQWPVEKYAAAVQPLKSRMGLESVAAGGPGDVEMASRIGAKFNVAGKTNLRQMVALLERADLVIAADTGPMHIAAALGRPLVSPYGPTDPVRTGPFGRMDSVIRLDIPCSPCFSRTCSHRSCLVGLEVESVMEMALEKTGARM